MPLEYAYVFVVVCFVFFVLQGYSGICPEPNNFQKYKPALQWVI